MSNCLILQVETLLSVQLTNSDAAHFKIPVVYFLEENMEKCNFQGKFPIITKSFLTDQIQLETLDAICSYFVNRIKQDPVARHIATFDHYAHTKSALDGIVGDNIIGAKNIIFCFGKKLIDPDMLAVRP